jgi:hypothetical protein
VTIRDARILYSNWTAVDVEAGNLTAYDSVVMHVGSTGCAWATSGTANMTLHRCYGWRANNDGFNVHGSGNTLLIDCDGSYNDDEGASAHETTYMEIIGGRYRYNVQAGTGNVGTSTAVIGGERAVRVQPAQRHRLPRGRWHRQFRGLHDDHHVRDLREQHRQRGAEHLQCPGAGRRVAVRHRPGQHQRRLRDLRGVTDG